jgi:hypothetical protein
MVEKMEEDVAERYIEETGDFLIILGSCLMAGEIPREETMFLRNGLRTGDG